MFKACLVLLCWLMFLMSANATTPVRMNRLNCDLWLKENASGYIYMVEGYLLGLYQIQSLTGNPSGSFSKVSVKELPQRVQAICQKYPRANVGEIALRVKDDLDQSSQLEP
jgi:hypothetical protein